MTRRLFSGLLCAFALLLLMGAGVAPQRTAALLAEEESVASAALLNTKNTNEANGGMVHAVVGASPLALAEQVEESILVDGVHAPLAIGADRLKGITYVSLAVMAQLMDETAKVTWSEASGLVTVTTDKLHLTAKVGQLYMEANGRYLYLSEGVQLMNGRVAVPLTALVKAFDGSVAWDAENEVISVTRGSGAILNGDEFYDEDTLFWLSRVIYAESGNQPLEGKMAVGNVVMNRLDNPIFPDTIKEVLAQKNQFSTYKNGRLANRTPNASSVVAAKLVLDGGEVEETLGALYFDSCKTSWASRNKECVAVIGGHKFFK